MVAEHLDGFLRLRPPREMQYLHGAIVHKRAKCDFLRAFLGLLPPSMTKNEGPPQLILSRTAVVHSPRVEKWQDRSSNAGCGEVCASQTKLLMT